MPIKDRNRNKSHHTKSSRSVPIERLIQAEAKNAVNSHFLRMQALDAYSKRLEEIDKQFDDIIQRAFSESNHAHRAIKFLHIAGFMIATLTLFAGLYLLLLQNRDGGLDDPAAICVAGGLLALVYLQNSGPTKKLNSWAKHLSTLTYIYLGYTHQLHQIDAVFKRAFSVNTEIDPARFEEMLQQVQDITDEAIGKVVYTMDKSDD